LIYGAHAVCFYVLVAILDTLPSMYLLVIFFLNKWMTLVKLPGLQTHAHSELYWVFKHRDLAALPPHLFPCHTQNYFECYPFKTVVGFLNLMWW
jgi:hypothetical protein